MDSFQRIQLQYFLFFSSFSYSFSYCLHKRQLKSIFYHGHTVRLLLSVIPGRISFPCLLKNVSLILLASLSNLRHWVIKESNDFQKKMYLQRKMLPIQPLGQILFFQMSKIYAYLWAITDNLKHQSLSSILFCKAVKAYVVILLAKEVSNPIFLLIFSFLFAIYAAPYFVSIQTP